MLDSCPSQGACPVDANRWHMSAWLSGLLRTTRTLSARDALHVAVMQGRDIDRILSFDVGFDGIPGIDRVT